jgi:hypothetical protein
MASADHPASLAFPVVLHLGESVESDESTLHKLELKDIPKEAALGGLLRARLSAKSWCGKSPHCGRHLLVEVCDSKAVPPGTRLYYLGRKRKRPSSEAGGGRDNPRQAAAAEEAATDTTEPPAASATSTLTTLVVSTVAGGVSMKEGSGSDPSGAPRLLLHSATCGGGGSPSAATTSTGNPLGTDGIGIVVNSGNTTMRMDSSDYHRELNMQLRDDEAVAQCARQMADELVGQLGEQLAAKLAEEPVSDEQLSSLACAIIKCHTERPLHDALKAELQERIGGCEGERGSADSFGGEVEGECGSEDSFGGEVEGECGSEDSFGGEVEGEWECGSEDSFGGEVEGEGECGSEDSFGGEVEGECGSEDSFGGEVEGEWEADAYSDAEVEGEGEAVGYSDAEVEGERDTGGSPPPTPIPPQRIEPSTGLDGDYWTRACLCVRQCRITN